MDVILWRRRRVHKIHVLHADGNARERTIIIIIIRGSVILIYILDVIMLMNTKWSKRRHHLPIHRIFSSLGCRRLAALPLYIFCSLSDHWMVRFRHALFSWIDASQFWHSLHITISFCGRCVFALQPYVLVCNMNLSHANYTHKMCKRNEYIYFF